MKMTAMDEVQKAWYGLQVPVTVHYPAPDDLVVSADTRDEDGCPYGTSDTMEVVGRRLVEVAEALAYRGHVDQRLVHISLSVRYE